MRKAQSFLGTPTVLILVGIAALLIIFYGPLSSMINASEKVNPPCEKRGGECLEECEDYLEENYELGGFQCKSKEYCCVKKSE